ncbi:AEC family transporter [Catenovulum maritimum]|uniref:Transporter n=1 Tax=Catenovulum maritimum TaxID=1513271 RepID=A0A0J8GSW9_9ALTE|nr:AEC family transporter [Catenovulum maritimum]KMT65885.1 hypothetical protein XM47_06740 [Catenovulum maritimum]
MQTFLANLLFTLNITLPILIVLALGIWLKKRNVIDSHFTEIGNKLVFNVALPCLLFVKIADAPILSTLNAQFLGFAAGFTILLVVLLTVFLNILTKNSEKSAVFVQSAYRGNMGIIGLALIFNIYPNDSAALAEAAVYLGVMTLVYNVVAIFLLQPTDKIFSLKTVKNLISNPLIIAIVLASVWSILGIPLFSAIKQTGNYFASLSLPLALICIGASLKMKSLYTNKHWVVWASFVKLALMPVLAVIIAWYLDFSHTQIAILFIYMCTPTAAASYVMAKQMTSQADLAAETIAVTTILSTLSITIGIFSLKSLAII